MYALRACHHGCRAAESQSVGAPRWRQVTKAGISMSADRLGLQQSIAAAGVILSLLFVGYEIRQNTRIARAAAVQTTQGQIVQWQSETSLDDDWVRIHTFVQREGGTFAELSPRDQTKYAWVVGSTVRLMETRYRQVQLGVLSEDDLLIGGGAANPGWYQAPHYIDWWKSEDRTRSWAPDFIEYFESEILEIR